MAESKLKIGRTMNKKILNYVILLMPMFIIYNVLATTSGTFISQIENGMGLVLIWFIMYLSYLLILPYIKLLIRSVVFFTNCFDKMNTPMNTQYLCNSIKDTFICFSEKFYFYLLVMFVFLLIAHPFAKYDVSDILPIMFNLVHIILLCVAIIGSIIKYRTHMLTTSEDLDSYKVEKLEEIADTLHEIKSNML